MRPRFVIYTLLVILIALIFAAPYVYQLFRKDTTINPKDLDTAVALLEKAKKSQPGITAYKKAAPGVVIELNTTDTAKLTYLSQFTRFENYAEAGGYFEESEG